MSETQHFEDDFVFRGRAFRSGVAHENAVAENGAVDTHVSLAITFEIGADKLTRRPFQDLRYVPSRSEPGAAWLFGDLDEHLVTGDRIVGVSFSDVNLRPGRAVDGMGPNKAETGRSAAGKSRPLFRALAKAE